VFSAARLGFRGTDLALSDLVSDPERPDIVRATALYYLRRYRTQRSLVAIESALSDANPLVRAEAVSALAMLEPQQRPPLAFHMLNDPVRAVRLAAAQVLADVPRNQLTTAQSVALNAAIDEYVQGQLANADRPTAHLNIGVIEAARGRPEASEAAYRTALRIGPWFIPTYVNLADLYRLLGRDLEGEIVLREALELAPDNADVHHSLGLLLTRLRRTDEALEMLGRATELDPASIQYNYVYAVALNSLERADEAIAVLERSLETHPYDRTLLFLAGAIHRDRGELNTAIGYVRRLLEAWPDDAEAAQFLAALEAEVQAR
jgi:tetratricopeptide (TPR) repeat protein